MRDINLDEALRTNGIGALISNLREDEKFEDWREKSVVVKNLVLGSKYPEGPIEFLESKTTLGVENVATAFGEMGYKFIPGNDFTKYYNCDRISFGKYTEEVVRYLTSNYEDAFSNKLTFKLNLNDLPYLAYIKYTNCDYNIVEKRLMDKFCSQELKFLVAEELNKSPKDAEEYIRSGIHNWIIIILTKYDLKKGIDIAKYYDFKNRTYLDPDLKENSKKFKSKLVGEAKAFIRSELSKLNANFEFSEDNSSYPLFSEFIDSSLETFAIQSRRNRYKSTIELPEIRLNRKSVSNYIKKDIKNDKLKYDRNVIKVLKALIALL